MPPKGAKGKGGKQEKSSDETPEKVGTGNKAKCRHILCEKHAKVMEAYAKLQEGVPFNQVAQQYSEDKAKDGGNLGWMVRGGMVGPFQVSSQCFTRNNFLHRKEHLINQLGNMENPLKLHMGTSHKILTFFNIKKLSHTTSRRSFKLMMCNISV
jgi:NIMA-interacting peptidyl-prolyl cis-trans isomerase 4